MDQNYYLNLDDNDVLEWEERVPFSPFNSTDYDTPIPFPWKGGLWSVKWRINQRESRAFVGINKCNDLPGDWQLKFKYSFGLCPIPELSDSVPIIWTEVLQHTFVKPSEDYTDHSMLSLQPFTFIHSRATTYVTEDHDIILKCRLEAIPISTTVNQSYNSKSSTGMVGLQNLGATCYLNALLQMLYHINFFRKGVYEIPFENEEIQESTTLALQSVFSKLQLDVSAVTTFDLTRAFGWNTFEAFQQQDVQEMMRILLDKLEERMKNTPADGVIQKLFVGKVKSYIRCIQIDYESSREEDFYDLQLDVKGCKNIYESFAKYVAKETLTGENQYDAGDDRGKQDAEKGVQFSKLPPVLTIHLKRFEFDMQRMGFAKIHDRYEFPLRLDLNEFVTSDDSGTDTNRNVYHLHSVLVHSGDVSGGHYTAFIRPSVDGFWEEISTSNSESKVENGGKWYQFDDDIVTPADRREAVQMCYGSGYSRGSIARVGDFSSAYMLVYLREFEAPQIMKSVNIPIELSTRLTQEKLRKLQETLHQKHQESFSDLEYFLESDIEGFHGYREEEDLFSEKKSLKRLRILNESTYLGLFNQIAMEFKKQPCEIEIWKAYRKADDTRIRVYECLSSSDYFKPINLKDICIYFIRFVEETNSQLRQEIADIIRVGNTFVDALRHRYISSLPVGLNLKFDPCEGCGIGRSGYILKNFAIAARTEREVEDDQEDLDHVTMSKKQLVRYYHQLCEKEVVSLSQATSSCGEDDGLVFLRAYDTERNWTHSGLPRQQTLFSDNSESESSASEDEISLDGNEDHTPNLRTRRIIYLGCLKTSPTQSYQRLEEVFSMLLQRYYENAALDFPPNWKTLQFVTVSTTSDVTEYEYAPTKFLKDLGILAGDILYCFPVVEPESLPEETEGTVAFEDKLNKLFSINPYVRDIQDFFENETTKVTFVVKLPKYFEYAETLNRTTGIWNLSDCSASTFPNRIISYDGIKLSLSLRKRCFDIISHLEDYFRVSNENRLMAGKFYFSSNIPHFRQLKSQENDMTLNQFIWINTRQPKHILTLVLLPFPINDYLIHDYRYLEFQICDFRLRSKRSEWLNQFIYQQASDLYRQQIVTLLEENSSLADNLINRDHLYPISQSLIWPESTTPLPDEWIFEDKLFLRFSSSPDEEDIGVSDVINEVKGQIYVNEKKTELRAKRQISDIASDDSDSESKKDDSSWILPKRFKNDSKKFVPRGGFESDPSQIESQESFMDEFEYQNPFLFADSPWEGVLHLSERVQLSATSEEDWGGPYLLLFEIDDHKVGKIFRPKSTLSKLPISWMESFLGAERFIYPVTLGVQLITSDDWIYMSGLAYSNFELCPTGTAESFCHDSKPVLSYIREDDTLDALITRIGSLTGETEWEKVVLVSRLLRIVDFPVASPLPPEIDSVGTRDEDGQEEVKDQGPSIWSLYEKYYPEYTSRDTTNSKLPLLGIQRSTRKPREPELQSRFRKQSGIKIRG